MRVLEADINQALNKKNVLFGEEKESVITFYSELNKWVWRTIRIALNEYNHGNHEQLLDRLYELRDAYTSANVAFSKVQLLLDDEEVIKNGHQAIEKALGLHHFKELLMLRLQRNLSWEKILVDQMTAKDFDFKSMSVDGKEFYKSQAEAKEKEREGIIKEFIDNHNTHSKQVFQSMSAFRNVARAYLKK